MSRVLIVATAGAGGDLPPLVAAALALRGRGHQTVFVGDASVARLLRPSGIESEMLPPALDLGPRLGSAIAEATAATRGDLHVAGSIVQARLGTWAQEVAGPLAVAIRRHDPAALITSLFGVEAVGLVTDARPWAVVNSTFYIGPDAARPLEVDFGPRAVSLMAHYAALLGDPDLVLHATDQVFDFGFDRLPPRHHYVGPLGVWEQPGAAPDYLATDGDPWVLVSISSQRQDDLPLAQVALSALADRPVRVVLTLGPDHGPAELESVPANARVEATVSHAAILEVGRLLVSHAGHGSVMKALWHGRPMVLVPWGRDQPGVAARAAALGVARVVARDSVSVESIGDAIDLVLASESMQQAAERHAARLRATDPAAVAASLLEGLL